LQTETDITLVGTLRAKYIKDAYKKVRVLGLGREKINMADSTKSPGVVEGEKTQSVFYIFTQCLLL